MQNLRVNFEASDWLTGMLESHGKKHPELETTKELVENFVMDLIREINDLHEPHRTEERKLFLDRYSQQ